MADYNRLSRLKRALIMLIRAVRLLRCFGPNRGAVENDDERRRNVKTMGGRKQYLPRKPNRNDIALERVSGYLG